MEVIKSGDCTTLKARAFLFAGQFLDVFTFALFFTLVPASVITELGKAERNPIIVALFAIGGVAAIAFAKLGLTSWVIYRDRHRTHRPKLTGAMMIIAGAAGFVGAFFNTMALKTVLGI